MSCITLQMHASVSLCTCKPTMNIVNRCNILIFLCNALQIYMMNFFKEQIADFLCMLKYDF